ncbi:unnamed protein product, partial [Scytosiphon promiscuus]
MASGRLGGGGGLLSRSRGRGSFGSQSGQAGGVNQETRMSFVKLSAGRRGDAPSREPATAPPTGGSCVGPGPSPSEPDEERKSRQATDCSSSSTATLTAAGAARDE